MRILVYFLLVIAGAFLIFWLRVFPFTEKKTKEPQRTANAALIRRRVESGTNRSGRSSGMGFSYVLTFRLEDGRELELYAYDTEYGTLSEGMEGTLTWKGPYYVSFSQA